MTLSVESEIEAEVLTSMVIYSLGGDLSAFENLPLVGREPRADRNRDMETLLATVVSQLSTMCLAKHVSQSYESIRESMGTLKGRLEFSPPPGFAGKVMCTHHLKSTDNLLNAIVLTGLVEADRILRNSLNPNPLCRSQLFIWSGLVQQRTIEFHHINEARSRLNRMTEHYRPLLGAIESLLFSIPPPLIGSHGGGLIQGVVVDLAVVFEKMVTRLIEAWLSSTHQVEVQKTMRREMIDGHGDVYFAPRPDIIVSARGAPKAIIDAKFKSDYVSAGAAGKPRSRVGRGDLYQMFYYSRRLRDRFQLQYSPRSLIIAPNFDGSVVDEARLTIQFSGRDKNLEMLEVVPLPVLQFFGGIKSGLSPMESIRTFAPSMAAVLDSVTSTYA
jgi:5-methylcytosine-specific restriction endonuclease McrBC regulatory subunit McrC